MTNFFTRRRGALPALAFAAMMLVPVACSTDTILESEDPDPYWKWIRARGGMDFVEDFVRPGTEDGVRLDVEPNFPRSVITDRIAPENVHRLIAQLKFCGGLS